MSIPITIAGTDFDLPTQGSNPPWGSDLSSIIQALAEVANNSVGAGDILTTNFTVANNQSAAANVTGAAFDTSTVRSSIISYSVYRSSSTTETSEVGQLMITYLSSAGTWTLAQYNAGTSGVTFSITNAGQLQYTSTNFGGTGYSGKLKFSARSFLQT